MGKYLKYLWIILPLLLLCCKDRRAGVVIPADEAKDTTVISASQSSEAGEIISFEKQQYIFELRIDKQRQEDIKRDLDSNYISPCKQDSCFRKFL